MVLNWSTACAKEQSQSYIPAAMLKKWTQCIDNPNIDFFPPPIGAGMKLVFSVETFFIVRFSMKWDHVFGETLAYWELNIYRSLFYMSFKALSTMQSTIILKEGLFWFLHHISWQSVVPKTPFDSYSVHAVPENTCCWRVFKFLMLWATKTNFYSS